MIVGCQQRDCARDLTAVLVTLAAFRSSWILRSPVDPITQLVAGKVERLRTLATEYMLFGQRQLPTPRKPLRNRDLMTT